MNSNFDGIILNHNLVVVSNNVVEYDIVIGFDVLSQFRYLSDENGYKFYSLTKNAKDNELEKIMNINISDEPEIVAPSQFKKQIEELKKNFIPARNAISPIKMKIVLEKDNPIYSSPSRLPPPEQKIVKEQVDLWLKGGIIRKSSSQYCSRVVLADKKDGSKRMCIDYRRINKICFKDRFPVPNMEDLIDCLSGSSVFSVLDIKNAFLHVPIEEESKKFTAFVTKEGIFEFNYAPFGFCNSPAVFIRFINTIFRNLVCEGIMQMYMDDIIIYTADYNTGMCHLQKVLSVAAKNNLEINWKKCKFLQKRVEFLGMNIENGTIKPCEDKIQAIRKFPEPSNIKCLQSFLGLTGYFRKFIENYSIIARPLTNLLKKTSSLQLV